MSLIRIVQQDTVIRVVQPEGGPTTVRVSGSGVQGPPGPRLVELVYMISGLVPATRLVVAYVATAAIEFIPADCQAVAGTANSVDCTLTIHTLDGTTVGTVTFLAGSTVGTVALDPLTLSAGDGLKFYHGPTIDTLADIVVTLPANR